MTTDEEKPSKTQRKRQVTALQDLGEELAVLADDQLASIELPDILRDAVMEVRRISSFEARRRQMQYIGKIMRKVDAAPIRAALEGFQTASRRETALHKRAEAWRERLLADEAALADFARDYPEADGRQLQKLVETTLRERAAGQPPRAFRQLYQALRALIENRDK